MNRKSEAIKIQIERAKELLKEIPVHIEYSFYNTALNRIYYACFYGARALSISIDALPKTHTGILKTIHLHFVQKGILDTKFSKLLAKLLQLRSKADYDGSFNAEKDEVENLLAEAETFLDIVQTLTSDVNN